MQNLTNLGSPERKVLGSLTNIPISPTANLKLLTNVASELHAPLGRKHPRSRLLSQFQKSDPRPRKEKSLGILCDRFLAIFPIQGPQGAETMEVCLDNVATKLGIVKRRIYDIINILESLQMASKTAKNRYNWHGYQNLESTLSRLKSLALKYKIDQKLKNIQSQQKDGHRLVSGAACCNLNKLPNNSILPKAEDKNQLTSKPCKDFFSDERTLGVMCQKFIMLFLVAEQNQLINLDLATRMLVSEAADNNSGLQEKELKCHCKESSDFEETCRCHLRLKTKVRRLYDIANVLTSLGLIRKVQIYSPKMKKPVFEYIGPAINEHSASFENETNVADPISHNSTSGDEECVENQILGRFSQKRKFLFDAYGTKTKFSRTSSENYLITNNATNVATESQRCKSSFLLQVAEQELEKLRSSEKCENSESRKRIFSHFHSDTCLQQSSYKSQQLNSKNEKPVESQATTFPTCSDDNNISSHAQNLTNEADSKPTAKKRFTILRKLVEVPSHALPTELPKNTSCTILKIPSSKEQNFGKSVTIPEDQTVSISDSDSKDKVVPTSRVKELTKFDRTKQTAKPISILRENLNLERQSKVKSSFGILTPVKVSNMTSILPGEMYKAVKFGNTVRLVPLVPRTDNKSLTSNVNDSFLQAT